MAVRHRRVISMVCVAMLLATCCLTFAQSTAPSTRGARAGRRGGRGPASRPSTVVGTLKILSIDTTRLSNSGATESRTLRVWLPAGYDADPTARYDVLYMHDAQNLFDRATGFGGNEWQIDETLTKLIADKTIRPIIVVGIDNGRNRMGEYTWVADPKDGGGTGAVYADFILHDLMPFIDKTFRTQTGPAHTFMGGSSLGGLISLEIARRFPNVFGGVIAMSPSVWWDDEAITKDVEQDPAGLKGTRIWLDMGTNEGGDGPRYVKTATRMDAALTKYGIEHHLMLDPGGIHNEIYWARRFPSAIVYLLNGTAPATEPSTAPSPN